MPQRRERHWIPACAGMTTLESSVMASSAIRLPVERRPAKAQSSFRRKPESSFFVRKTKRAGSPRSRGDELYIKNWIPAFAGITSLVVARKGYPSRSVPDSAALHPGTCADGPPSPPPLSRQRERGFKEPPSATPLRGRGASIATSPRLSYAETPRLSMPKRLASVMPQRLHRRNARRAQCRDGAGEGPGAEQCECDGGEHEGIARGDAVE